jgi:hypothetical protein
MKENKDFFEINPFILRPLMCTSKKEKIKILQNIYLFLKIIKKRLSCMSIYGFQAKLSYHCHICDIVYYNVSKLCTYVHIAISKHFCQLEFFYYYVFFPISKCPNVFSVNQDEKYMVWNGSTLGFTPSGPYLVPIPNFQKFSRFLATLAHLNNFMTI